MHQCWRRWCCAPLLWDITSFLESAGRLRPRRVGPLMQRRCRSPSLPALQFVALREHGPSLRCVAHALRACTSLLLYFWRGLLPQSILHHVAVLTSSLTRRLLVAPQCTRRACAVNWLKVQAQAACMQRLLTQCPPPPTPRKPQAPPPLATSCPQPSAPHPQTPANSSQLLLTALCIRIPWHR